MRSLRGRSTVAAIRLAACALAVAALAACDTTATLYFQLAFPPGQTRLPEGTTRVRLTLEAPHEVREAPVAADGSFTLALELGARGGAGRISFEALDAAGAVVAIGRSAPLPLNGYEDQFTLYVSPPDAFAEAPVSLDEPHQWLAAAALPYGAILAGGEAEGRRVTRDVRIYNVYSHTLQLGADLPAARAHQTVVALDSGLVFLFGGWDVTDSPTEGELWIFDTNVAPAGSYRDLPGDPTLAPAGGQAAQLGDGRYAVAAAQLPIIDPLTGAVTHATTDASVGDGATTATALLDGRVLVAGALGCFLVDADGAGYDPVLPGRGGHGAVRLPDGRVLLVGGSTDGMDARDAIGVDASGVPFVLPVFLATARSSPAVAVAGNRLIVAGGDGVGGSEDPRATAEVFDATTLESLGTVPLAGPRVRASAITLANDSVLLVGGEAATIELFQPAAASEAP